jgi:hypothetical protein
MADTDRCPTCGSEPSAATLEGLCPYCLLQVGVLGEAFETDGAEQGANVDLPKHTPRHGPSATDPPLKAPLGDA